MPADITESLKLWEHIFGEQRGLLQIWSAFREENGRLLKPHAANFNYPNAMPDAATFALEKSKEGREVYFCAHLLVGPERTKENAAEVGALWFETDGGKLPNSTLKPTAVVQSSAGRYHGYLRLVDPIPPKTAEELNKRLAHKIGADPSGADRTQLLRVPGTTNYKYEQRPGVELMYLNGAVYSPAALEEVLPKAPEIKSSAPEVEDRIESGDRNIKLASLAGTMRRRGMEEEEIAAALLVTNERRCDPPLEEAEVRAIARSIASYEPEPERNSHSHSHKDSPVNEYPKKDLRAVSFVGRPKPPPQEFVVEQIMPCGLATSFYGAGGVAKSVNVLHLAMSVAFNGIGEWHSLQVMTCPVVYLDFEMSEIVQLRRAKEIAEGACWPDTPANFRYVEAAGHPTEDVFGFALELIREHGPSLVVIDSFGYSMEGESERSSDVLSYVRNYIQPLQDAGSHPLVVDHIARAVKGERAADKEAFGSVYKTNSMRSTVNVTGHADEELVRFTPPSPTARAMSAPDLSPLPLSLGSLLTRLPLNSATR